MRSEETLKEYCVLIWDINVSTLKSALDTVYGGVIPCGFQCSVQF